MSSVTSLEHARELLAIADELALQIVQQWAARPSGQTCFAGRVLTGPFGRDSSDKHWLVFDLGQLGWLRWLLLCDSGTVVLKTPYRPIERDGQLLRQPMTPSEADALLQYLR